MNIQRHWLCVLYFVGILSSLSACGGGSSDGSGLSPTPTPMSTPALTPTPTAAPTRSFYMGFTPWPYDATVDAITNTYRLIQEHGDSVKHHLMDGVPWESAFSEAALPDHVESDISSRLQQTQSNKMVFLEIDSLNTGRDDLAPDWGENGGQARPMPWDARSFDDQPVIDAYANFAIDMVSRFNPRYLNYGPEVSELILNDDENNTTKFDEFIVFAAGVYTKIKAAHPNLELAVSVALKSPGSAEATRIQTRMAELNNYVDIYGVSVYPYAFYSHNDRGDPANLPSNWLSQITAIAGTKPIGISETGWIAENLDIPGFGYSEQSDVTKQNNYVSVLLDESNRLSARFVLWFSIADYDNLWTGVLGEDDLSKIWKDTGIYDGDIQPRASLNTWDQFFSRVRGPGVN